jgi:NAD(P)-dependent dehydrogenase (short-subunit alcohol dehydrogenase family)
MYNPLDLSGKLVLVTGASSGIGRATAVVLSRLGARLVLAGRRADALQETLAATENPANHLCSTFDLANLDDIPKWIAEVVNLAGAPLDGTVHCAGVTSFLPLRVVSSGNIDSIMVPNLHAALMLLRGVSARNAVPAAGASVVFISSAAALMASPGLSTYSASKAALGAVARCAAKELAAKRVRVNCIAPGYVKTPMLDQAANAFVDFDRIEKAQFLGFIDPDEIGTMAAYLLSSAARSITGSQFVMDGGFTL